MKNMDVFSIYRRLFDFYGPQHWWPTKNQKSKACPERSRGIKNQNEQFEIAVGAILTQNTAWKNVAKAIDNLCQAKALTPTKIVALKKSKLEKLIRPAGYFRQKTKKLKIFSKWLIKNYNGDLRKIFKKKTPDTRHELLNLWGIGPETADSILLYAGNKPIFVIDAYTRRLCAKFGKHFKTYDEYQRFFTVSLRAPKGRSNPVAKTGGLLRRPRGLLAMTNLFNEFHALIVASGKDNHKIFTLLNAASRQSAKGGLFNRVNP